jgi:archaetidylinositol phosphate synthase
MAGIETHIRVHDMLLGPLERPALRWLASRLPAAMTPDVLTGIGIAGSILIFSGYALSLRGPGWLWLASCGFLINWFGDSLDGTVARYRKIERPKYGFFVDHTVDAGSTVLVFTGMGLSPYLRFEIACLALVGYLLMSLLAYVRTCVDGVFQVSYSRIGPTEMRLIAILANAALFFFGNPTVAGPWGLTLTVLDAFAAALAAGLFISFAVSTARRAIQLAREGR